MVAGTLYRISYLDNKNDTECSYQFWNILIHANSLVKRVLTRSFIMLNTKIEKMKAKFLLIFPSYL